MSVYVDDMRASLGRMKMCHMIADSHDELMAIVATIGVDPKWIQDAGTHREHFDIALSKRALALAAGAIPVTLRELANMTRARRLAARSPLPRSET
jgi:NRPS condensation-like uncharacterized protein